MGSYWNAAPSLRLLRFVFRFGVFRRGFFGVGRLAVRAGFMLVVLGQLGGGVLLAGIEAECDGGGGN